MQSQIQQTATRETAKAWPAIREAQEKTLLSGDWTALGRRVLVEAQRRTAAELQRRLEAQFATPDDGSSS